MAVVINGSGTVTGLAVGGLPDGTVDAGTLATDSVTSAKITDGAITNADINASAAIAASKLSGTGKVLQVVSATQTSSVSTTSASMVDTGLTATITPTADDSTILVFSTISLYTQSVSGDTRIGGKLLRDAVSLFSNNYVSRSATGGNDKRTWAVNIEDSPTTTSELVYKMQFCRTTGSGTIYVGINSEPSSMILMEIGA